MFKILLPVTSPAFLVEQKLQELAGYEQQTIIINNWTDPETAKYVKIFAERGAEAYDCSYNLGLAASWNFGMKRMMEDGDQFVIFLSASAVFDKSIQYFIDDIVNREAVQGRCRYICDAVTSLHCFAHTRLGVEMGGYFDENFWPIYYEDTDYGHRSKFNGVGTRPSSYAERSAMNTEGAPMVVICALDGVVHSYGASIACNKNQALMSLHQHNCDRWSRYYVAKWGGQHGSEQYIVPFNDPSRHINDWSINEPFLHPAFPHPWNPPPPQKRY